MNIEEILESLNDGCEYDSYNRTIVPSALAQSLIIEAAFLHKPKWIDSQEDFPELVLSPVGIYSFSNDILLYYYGDQCVAYLEYDSSNMQYFWRYGDGYRLDTINTYWMPLPPNPEI